MRQPKTIVGDCMREVGQSMYTNDILRNTRPPLDVCAALVVIRGTYLSVTSSLFREKEEERVSDSSSP